MELVLYDMELVLYDMELVLYDMELVLYGAHIRRLLISRREKSRSSTDLMAGGRWSL